MSVVTLLTDFGDFYPGVMKGVILSVNPDVKIVDISHGVPPQHVRCGAFLLYVAVPFFPRGSVHVAVVDPGVGTSRRPLVVSAGGSFLVGPDNGVLIPAARRLGRFSVYEIALDGSVSDTFHGRDVFAPVAARLARGDVSSLGQEVSDFVDMDFGEVMEKEDRIRGEIVFVDAFGNLVTNIPGGLVAGKKSISVFGMRVPFLRTYGLARQGEVLALVGSHGFLEIAVNGGSAARLLGCGEGDRVEISFQELK